MFTLCCMSRTARVMRVFRCSLSSRAGAKKNKDTCAASWGWEFLTKSPEIEAFLEAASGFRNAANSAGQDGGTQ